jgi:hypothetical protein
MRSASRATSAAGRRRSDTLDEVAFRLFAPLIALAALVACGQTLAEVGEDPAAAAADASTTDSGIGAADVSTSEASSEAGGGGCFTPFEDDFDRTNFSIGWSQSSISGGSAIAPETAMPWMGISFKASTDAFPVRRLAALEQRFETPPKSISCTFKIRLDAPANSGRVDALVLTLTDAEGKGTRLGFSVQHSGLTLQEDVFDTAGNCVPGSCPKGKTSLAKSITTGAWSTVTFSTDFNTASAGLEGGASIGGPFVGFTPTEVALLLGVVNFSPEIASHTLDHLVCRLGC